MALDCTLPEPLPFAASAIHALLAGDFPSFAWSQARAIYKDRTFGGQFKQARHSERRKHRATTKSGHSQYLEKSVAGVFAIL
jgi:hypothetical protein